MDAAGQVGGTHGHLDDGDVDGVHCGYDMGTGNDLRGGEDENI